jgi:hypothetical protein
MSDEDDEYQCDDFRCHSGHFQLNIRGAGFSVSLVSPADKIDLLTLMDFTEALSLFLTDEDFKKRAKVRLIKMFQEE